MKVLSKLLPYYVRGIKLYPAKGLQFQCYEEL